MKELLDGGLINGECLTVTGRTVSENLSSTPCVHDLAKQVSITELRICISNASTLLYCSSRVVQDILFSLNAPLAPAGRHMIILRVCALCIIMYSVGMFGNVHVYKLCLIYMYMYNINAG